MNHVHSLLSVLGRYQSCCRYLEETLSAFKLKCKHPLGLAFTSPTDKDPMLKSAKVFRVQVCEKESEAKRSSESCDISHDHNQTKTLGPDWPGNHPVNQVIWIDQSASKDITALEIRTSCHNPNLPHQMKRKHHLTFLCSIQGYTRTVKAKVNTLYKCKADKVHPVNYSGPSVKGVARRRGLRARKCDRTGKG